MTVPSLKVSSLITPIALSDLNWSWGVDSTTPLTAMHQGLKLPKFLEQHAGRPAAFWGRYIAGRWGVLAPDEIAGIRNDPELQVPIFLLDGSLTAARIRSSGEDAAAKCIQAAVTLGIPRNQGLCLFGDIESDMSPTEEWIEGWAKGFVSSGFIGGLYGNATRDTFSKPFNTAFVAEPAVRQLLYYASHLEYEANSQWGDQGNIPIPFAQNGFPTIPSTLSGGAEEQLVLWQYVENCACGLFDYDLMTDKGLNACWRPWVEKG